MRQLLNHRILQIVEHSPQEVFMTNGATPLEKTKVAASCSSEWRFMHGNDCARFCGQCSQYVYNLSTLTREEAEFVILKTEGRICDRYYRRTDGTIITNNCPVGLRASKAKYKTTKATIIKAAMLFIAYVGVLWWFERSPIAKPKVTCAVTQPKPFPAARIVTKSEEFIRDRAVYKVTPVACDQSGNQMEGDAVVGVVISPAGLVLKATLINGQPELKKIAEGAAWRWEFEPMSEGGESVSVESVLSFHFEKVSLH